jgi:hypothetical protein
MTDFSIDGREIDVESLSDQGKAALQKAVNLNQQLLVIEEQRQDLSLLMNHYVSIVREETAEEDE